MGACSSGQARKPQEKELTEVLMKCSRHVRPNVFESIIDLLKQHEIISDSWSTAKIPTLLRRSRSLSNIEQSNVNKNNEEKYHGRTPPLKQHQQNDNHRPEDKVKRSQNKKQTFKVNIRNNEQLPAILVRSEGDNNLQQRKTIMKDNNKFDSTPAAQTHLKHEVHLARNNESEAAKGGDPLLRDKKEFVSRPEHVQACTSNRKTEKSVQTQFSGEKTKKNVQTQTFNMKTNKNVQSQTDRKPNEPLRVQTVDRKSNESLQTQSSIGKATKNVQTQTVNRKKSESMQTQTAEIVEENKCLLSKISQLEEMIGKLQNNIDKKDIQLRTVQTSDEILKQEQKTKDERQKALHDDEKTRMRSNMEIHQRDNQRLKSELCVCKNELKSVKSNKEKLTEELETLRQEYQTTRTDHGEQTVSLKREKSALQHDISVLEKQLNDCKDELNIVLSNKATLSKELESLQQEYHTIRTDLEEQNVSLRGDNTALLSTLEKQQRNISMMERQLDEEYRESRRLHREVGPSDMIDLQWRDEPIFDKQYLQNLKEEVEHFWPLRDMGVAEDALRHVNILFVGPIGAGKSSFINSVESVFRGYVTMTASAGSRSKSLTSMYHQYQILSSDNRHPMKFQLCDCRGLEDRVGISRDIDSILEGHIPDNYVFNTSFPIISNMEGYKSFPRLENKIHCVVYVLDASTYSADLAIPFVSDPVRKSIKAIQESVDQKGIPQLVILSKVDSVCESTRQDTSLVYQSPVIRQRCIDAAGFLGVPPMLVLPMKNYILETSTTDDISILALYNIRQMLRAADSYLRVNHLSELRDYRHD
ncbi:paramyosin-like [Pecten maximus]|uniref:paramyosin-like n=1 Tax=Pecten maximus TaxID=6579 RepID=UPI0014585E02|nr:paramyosin-like [Pecten maximus]